MRAREFVRSARWIAAPVGLFVAGCSNEVANVPTRPSGRWGCPSGWVAGEHGGCGPAVLLCVPGGGAAAHACDGVDLTRPPVIALPDGGAARGLYRLPDGGIGGGWPEPGDPDGPPTEGWVPDAGIATCAEGWRRLPDGTCDPLLRDDCPEGSGPLPGGLCTPTALTDCPAGEYADLGAEAVGARVVHVRAGAVSTGADGSAERPYATIAAGMRSAGSGGWVRVAAGEYRERLVVGAGVNMHVVGVCAARVTLHRPESAGSNSATVSVSGAGRAFDLRGVTVTGSGPGIGVSDGAELRAAAVVVADNLGSGVIAGGSGTRAEVAASVIRGTLPSPDATGFGLLVHTGATLRTTSVVVTDNVGVGVAAIGPGTRVEMNANVVMGTQPGANGTFGHGLEVQRGAALHATGVVVSGNFEVGCEVWGADTQAQVSASVVRGTRSNLNGILGSGLEVQLGATLRVANLLVDENGETGVGAHGLGTHAEVRASVVRRTRPNRDGQGGRGVLAQDGATLNATGVIIADNTATGLNADGEGTQVEVSACVVRGTQPISNGRLGHGLQASRGAALRATDVLITNNTASGFLVMGDGTLAEMSRCVVTDTRSQSRNAPGRGLVVQEGATLRASGVLIRNNLNVGVSVIGAGTEVDMTASAVRDTRPGLDGLFGRGLDVEQATFRAAGLLVANNAEIGVFVNGGNVRFTDLVVIDTSPSLRGFGVGLYATRGARVEGTGAAIQTVGGAGIVAQGESAHERTSITTSDLYVRGVRPSTVRFRESGSTLQPEGRSVAYGLLVGAGCVIDGARAIFSGGGFGFYNAGGLVRLRQGVITRQLDAAGARDLATPASSVTLDDVARENNVDDEVVRRDDLPTASSLPPLPPVQIDL